MIKKMGILGEFIKNKIENYVEPERKGTPKGELIGFSLVKYKATLFMLTNKKVKEIVKILGISEGLLRKWKTEQSFKDLENEHINDFINYYTIRIKAKANEQEKLDDDFYNQPSEKIKGNPPDVDISEFDEVGYSYKLRKLLNEHISYLHEHHRSLLTPKETIITSKITLDTWRCEMIENGYSPEEAEKIASEREREEFKSHIHQANKTSIEMIRIVLSNPSATDYDKKVALSFLSLLERQLLK